MKIGGLQKLSLIDYPGKICAIVFTQGCNFRCPYCHNPELVDPRRYGPVFPEAQVISFLEKRKGKLEALSITGGEPTLQPDLEKFIKTVKELGFLVKLDTNGSRPDVIERLASSRLVDFWAMDVKGPLHKYGAIAGVPVDVEKIKRSISLIIASGVEHEFRTTVVRSMLDREDLLEIAQLVKGADSFALQGFVPVKTLDEDFLMETTYGADEFLLFKNDFDAVGTRVIVR